jgi:hypothetical protein
VENILFSGDQAITTLIARTLLLSLERELLNIFQFPYLFATILKQNKPIKYFDGVIKILINQSIP